MSIRLAVGMGAAACVGIAVYESWNLFSSEEYDFLQDGAAITRVAMELGIGLALVQTLPELHSHTPWSHARGIFLRHHEAVLNGCDRAIRNVFKYVVSMHSKQLLLDKNLLYKEKKMG